MRRRAGAAGPTLPLTAQGRRWPVLEDLTYDDSEPPPIGLVPSGATWAQVRDHIKIAHDFLLVPGDGSCAGAYWTGTEMVVLRDLGPQTDDALDEFREQLRQRGEL
jgi:hypothetical protein